jgi:hypothetical protein
VLDRLRFAMVDDLLGQLVITDGLHNRHARPEGALLNPLVRFPG